MDKNTEKEPSYTIYRVPFKHCLWLYRLLLYS